MIRQCIKTDQNFLRRSGVILRERTSVATHATAIPIGRAATCAAVCESIDAHIDDKHISASVGSCTTHPSQRMTLATSEARTNQNGWSAIIVVLTFGCNYMRHSRRQRRAVFLLVNQIVEQAHFER